MVKVTVSPTEADRGLPAFERAGSTITAAPTVNVSVAVLPIPPFVDDTFWLTLFRTPTVDAVTFTMIVQTPPPVMLPPLKLTLSTPETAVIVPPQLLARFSGDALTTPLG
jgi:hypothetical protein